MEDMYQDDAGSSGQVLEEQLLVEMLFLSKLFILRLQQCRQDVQLLRYTS